VTSPSQVKDEPEPGEGNCDVRHGLERAAEEYGAEGEDLADPTQQREQDDGDHRQREPHEQNEE